MQIRKFYSANTCANYVSCCYPSESKSDIYIDKILRDASQVEK
jgi:hypothetical protein